MLRLAPRIGVVPIRTLVGVGAAAFRPIAPQFAHRWNRAPTASFTSTNRIRLAQQQQQQHPSSSSSSSTSSPQTPPSGDPSTYASGWEARASVIPVSELDLANEQPPLPKHIEHGYLVYTSPFERAVKTLKMLSLTSALMSIASAPVMVVLAQDMPLPGRLAIAGTVLVFGISTTLVLTHFLRSYVIRIFAKRDTNAAVTPNATSEEQASEQYKMTVQTFNLFGRPVYTQARHADFQPLHSRLFNNTRMTTVDKNGQPVKRDLFVHLDIAEHPLLLPWWHKATVLSQQPSSIEQFTEEPAEIAAAMEKVKKEPTLTREQARKEIFEEERKRAEEAKQAAANKQ